MLKYILFFIILLSNANSSICVTNNINGDKPITLCVDTNDSTCIASICSTGKECIKNDRLVNDNFLYGRDKGYIDIEKLKNGFLLTLSNISFYINNINKVPIIHEIITYGYERNIVKFNGEKGTFCQRKKTKVDKPFVSFSIDSYSNKIYPANIHTSYKKLISGLKAVKNRILTETDLYNIVFENGIHDKTVVQINDLAYYYSLYHPKSYTLVEIYRDIIQKFPNRTVAYYNLGDAYWELGEKKKAIKAYTTYIEQMCHKGLQKKIPKVVLERVSNKK